ncbi:MAG: hypothetical protein KBD53_05275 [Candidatus Omnitrophica bacterium]|nr:hypothetical protein [Candidatus Omnitrophota bacterium]
MKKYLLIILFTFIFISTVRIHSGESATVKNPFTPQLPKKIKIVEKNGKPTDKKILKDSTPKTNSSQSKSSKQNNAESKTSSTPQPNFVVTGIIWNSDRPQAIINSQVLDIGDSIQEYKVESIEKEGIVMSNKDIKMTIKP